METLDLAYQAGCSLAGARHDFWEARNAFGKGQILDDAVRGTSGYQEREHTRPELITHQV